MANIVVLNGGAAFVALRALCNAKPMANEDRMKKTIDTERIGIFVVDSICCAFVKSMFWNRKYNNRMLTVICTEISIARLRLVGLFISF